MRMMLVGSGAVGECIVKMLKERDEAGEWFEFCLLCDISLERAEEVQRNLNDARFYAEYLDATKKEEIKKLIKEYNIDFVMDASRPFCEN